MRPRPPLASTALRALGVSTDTLSPAQLRDVSTWWGRLAPEDRRSVRRLLIDETTRPAFDLRIIGRFVNALSHDDAAKPPPDTDDYYEYLVNHELTLEDKRTFHICSAHEEARALVVTG